MKRILTRILPTFLLLIFSHHLLLADAWFQINNSCNWFTKRYKVHVGIKRAWQVGNHCAYTAVDCSYIQRDCRYPEPEPNTPFQIFYAVADAMASANNPYAYHSGGFDGTDQWLAGSDVTTQIPLFSPFPMIEQEKNKKDRVSSGRLQIGSTVFDNQRHQVRLSDIKGYLSVKSFDKANDFSTFTVSITMIDTLNPDDFSDAGYTKNLIWSTKAMVHNGKLLLEGKFNIKDFHIYESVQSDSISLAMNDLTIDIPAHIDMELLTVNVGVDNGNFGMGISEKFRMSGQKSEHFISETMLTEEIFTFKNYPNPVKDQITINFEVPYKQEVELAIYDPNGDKLLTLYQNQVEADQLVEVESDLRQLKAGVYYLKLKTAEKILVRKLIVW